MPRPSRRDMTDAGALCQDAQRPWAWESRLLRTCRTWILAAGLALASNWAVAQDSADAVVQQLREQGYVEFTISRTLLGRVRVLALAPDGSQREIVFNPATGEILRDYSEGPDGDVAPRILSRPEDESRTPEAPTPSGSGGGAGGPSQPEGDDGNHGHGNDAGGFDGDNPGQGHGPGGNPGNGGRGNPSRGGGNGKD